MKSLYFIRDYYETYIEKRMANDNHHEDSDSIPNPNDSGFRESTPVSPTAEESSR